MNIVDDRIRHRVELQSLYRLVVDREMRKTDFILVQPLTAAVPDKSKKTALAAPQKTDISLNR